MFQAQPNEMLFNVKLLDLNIILPYNIDSSIKIISQYNLMQLYILFNVYMSS